MKQKGWEGGPRLTLFEIVERHDHWYTQGPADKIIHICSNWSEDNEVVDTMLNH
jgi:hypothetical protein